MAECESCHEAVPDGLIHVPAERVGGEVLREPTIDSPGEYAPPPDPGCNTVTIEQLHDYLAAHCTNCGGLLDDGTEHHTLDIGSCIVEPFPEPAPEVDGPVPLGAVLDARFGRQ